MFYRILASGPIIEGRGTVPHRLVLVSWSYDNDHDANNINKMSVHTQSFDPERSKTSLFQGHYFVSDDKEVEAPLLFSRKLAEMLKTYGHDINTKFVPEAYGSAYEGQAG